MSIGRVLGWQTWNVQNKVRAYLDRNQRGILQVRYEPKGETKSKGQAWGSSV